MISTQKLLLSIALTLSLQSMSFAQDELLFHDHHIIHGEVISSTSDSVTFKHIAGKMTETETYMAADIDPVNFYIIRSKAVKGDAAAMMVLGRFCHKNGLFTRAKNQFIRSRKLDGTIDIKADIDAANDGIATQLLAEAQAFATDGKYKKAIYRTNTIIRRFSMTPQAAKAREINASAYKSLVGKRDTMMAAMETSGENKDVVRVIKEINKAADSNAKALQSTNAVAANREFGSAIKEYQKALELLDGVAKKYARDEGILEHVGSLRKQANADLIDVHISLGNGFLVQSSYQKAFKEANMALAVDGKSTVAKAFRAQVATAAAEASIGIIGAGGSGPGSIIE